MTLKKLFMLGGVLAGAAYLQNKERRERVFGQARGMLDKAKMRAQELQQRMGNQSIGEGSERSSSTSSYGSSATSGMGVGSTSGSIGSTSRDNGIRGGSSGYSGGTAGGYGGSGGSGTGGYR